MTDKVKLSMSDWRAIIGLAVVGASMVVFWVVFLIVFLDGTIKENAIILYGTIAAMMLGGIIGGFGEPAHPPTDGHQDDD